LYLDPIFFFNTNRYFNFDHGQYLLLPLHLVVDNNDLPLLISSQVSCGFASLVENSKERPLSLDEHLVRRSSSTFFLRAKGDSMLETIKPTDLLIVDRSLTPAQGHIVIAIWQGEFLCKRFFQLNDSIELRADNPKYPVVKIPLERSDDFVLWGVVTYVIHSTC
jgi:DNA polymerase V